MLTVYSTRHNHRTSQSAIKKATSILESIDRTNIHKSVNSRDKSISYSENYQDWIVFLKFYSTVTAFVFNNLSISRAVPTYKINTFFIANDDILFVTLVFLVLELIQFTNKNWLWFCSHHDFWIPFFSYQQITWLVTVTKWLNKIYRLPCSMDFHFRGCISTAKTEPFPLEF